MFAKKIKFNEVTYLFFYQSKQPAFKYEEQIHRLN
jgi:hypothetical protein